MGFCPRDEQLKTKHISVSLRNRTVLGRRKRKTFVCDKSDRANTYLFCRDLHLTFYVLWSIYEIIHFWTAVVDESNAEVTGSNPVEALIFFVVVVVIFFLLFFFFSGFFFPIASIRKFTAMIILHFHFMFSCLLQTDLFKGRLGLAECFFKQSYCHVCHTRFAVFFRLPALPYCCVTSLITK